MLRISMIFSLYILHRIVYNKNQLQQMRRANRKRESEGSYDD